MEEIPSTLMSGLALEKPNGSVPKQRIKSAEKAQSIVSTLVLADRDRAMVLAKVKGMMDGNAPYSSKALIDAGQANRTNVNFREGEAIRDSATTPYYDLFAESDTYSKVELDHDDENQRTEYSRKVTRRFDDMLKDWAGFDWNIQKSIQDMVGLGRGYVMWPDATNWQFDAISHSRVLVPDGTPSDIDQLELLVVRQSFTISKLYAKIRDNESARKVGWNIEAVMKAIAGAMPENRTDNATYDYEKIQEEIRNHDIYQSIRSDVIRAANVFVKEFDGRISHLIVEEVNSVQATDSEGNKKPLKFMFKKIGRYQSFRQAVGTLFFDIGDGTWHGIKGLGVKLHPFIEIKNRLNCSIVDNAFVNLSVLLRATSGKASDETALMQVGPLTILPPGFDVAQWGMQGRMEEGLAIESALSAKLESNTGQYRRPLMKESGNPDTATAVNYAATKEASLGKGAVNRFYTQLDNIFEEVYRRATNFDLIPEQNGRGPNCMALKFQEKCINDGIPKKMLKKIRYVRASRNSGNGSVFLRQQVVANTMALVPMMNEAGKQSWLDSAIAVMAGSENVDTWNPKQSMPATMQDQARTAMLENAAMKDGAPVMLVSTDNHFIHATTHLQGAADALNSIPQGGNPAAVLGFIDTVAPHAAQHIQFLSQDQSHKQEAKQLSDQLNQLGQMSDQLRKQLQKQQEEAARQQEEQQLAMQEQMARTQQVMTDEQIKQMTAQNNIELSRLKANERMRMSAERHAQDQALKRAKTEQDLMLGDASTAAEIRNSTVKTQAEIVNQSRKGSKKPSTE